MSFTARRLLVYNLNNELRLVMGATESCQTQAPVGPKIELSEASIYFYNNLLDLRVLSLLELRTIYEGLSAYDNSYIYMIIIIHGDIS